MKYYHNLYLSENLVEKKDEMLYKLEHHKIQLNKYVIVLPKNGKNHLEFYDTVLLSQSFYKHQELFVVGIADGFEEALLLVKIIVQEVYDATKGADIRTYLLERQRAFEERKV